jgi:hypothetical protein
MLAFGIGLWRPSAFDNIIEIVVLSHKATGRPV